MVLCRCKKSRAVDNAIIWYNEHPTYVLPTDAEVEALATADQPKPEIDDEVYDMHTAAGRKLGRGMEHFKTEGAALVNESDVAPFTPPTTMPCPHCSGTGKVPA